MNYEKIFKKFILGNNKGFLNYNNRYYAIKPEKNNNQININNKKKKKSSKHVSVSESLKKIEALKKKYNGFGSFNYEELVRKKIVKLKNKYSDENHKIPKMEKKEKIQPIKPYKTFKVQNTDNIKFTNDIIKKTNLNLVLSTSNNMDTKLNSFRTSTDIPFQKSNEINYQITCQSQNMIHGRNKTSVEVTENFEEKRKNLRNELSSLDKKINLILGIDNNDTYLETEEIIERENKRKQSCPIKERIVLLSGVKKKINQIHKNLMDDSGNKMKNSDFSIDSQISLGFKHIKPIIKRDNFISEYFKEDEIISNNETLSKPTLIKPFPRPKLNVPKYPSFFAKK